MSALLLLLTLTTSLSSDSLRLGPTTTLRPQGGRNPTLAVDPWHGTVYLAWAQHAPAAQDSTEDPALHVLLARSEDGGRTFSEPVSVHARTDRVASYTVSPTQVAVGPQGTVYVLYLHRDPTFRAPGWDWGRTSLRLTRSEDGGKTFSEPVTVGHEATEGIVTSTDMHYLFAAADGRVYIAWLDFRESLMPAANLPGGKPTTQLRVARSEDGGRTFAPSVLVARSTCGCCGTRVVQGNGGPLYAATRSEWYELKGSYDAVRDLFVSRSDDGGTSWSAPVKFHDDRFKISGCPDINPGLAVDTQGRLHAAWYTGTDRHPGIFYARSDDQGRSFSQPVALLTDTWIPYSDVRLAVEPGGMAWVVFEDRRGETDQLRVARIAPDGSVSFSAPWEGMAPDITLADDGIVVAWHTPSGEDSNQGAVCTRRITRGLP
jgi:hypothetical protein